MLPKVLLIVDDHRPWLNTLSRFFSTFKYKIYTAETCAEGIKLAALHRPDCILLDFHFPDGKGDEVCRAVRADLRLKNTPIIMISADPGEELNSYQKYKTDGFISKGASLFKIKVIVENVLRRIGENRGILDRGDIRLDARNFSVYRDSNLAAELSADQFRLLFLLLEKNREFVSDALIAEHVLEDDPKLDKSDAIRSLICRLRKKLGPQLARRIKNKRDKGWIYLQPRDRTRKITQIKAFPNFPATP